MKKKARKKTKGKHEFEKLTEFDRAMRKLVSTPKEEVKKREEAEKKGR